MTGKEKVRFGFGARRLMVVFLGGRTDKTAGTVCPVPPVFFDAEGVRSGRSRAGKGRRALPSPPRTTRACARRAVSGATASRRAFVASRDA